MKTLYCTVAFVLAVVGAAGLNQAVAGLTARECRLDSDTISVDQNQMACLPAVWADGQSPAAVVAGETVPAKALSPEDLFKKVSPSVVKIVIENDNSRVIGSGSGFFVLDPDYEFEHLPAVTMTVITNYHVIRSAVRATVEMADGRRADVQDVIAEDETSDLALLTGC